MVEIWDGVLTLPIIGSLDSSRTMIVMEKLLQRIESDRARVVVIDVTGVMAIDSQVSHHLIQMIRATGLMGATAILTGISSGAPNENQALTITALSSDPALIPHPAVAYSSPDRTGRLTFTPASNLLGRAEITVTLRDDGDTLHGGKNTVSRTFRISVGQPADLKLSIARSSGLVVLSFNTESGETYTIEFKDALSETAWRPLATTPGTGTTLTVNDSTASAAQRFCRLRMPGIFSGIWISFGK